MNLIKLLTPTNLAEEKDKFFADSNYHPQFQYDWNNKEVKHFLESNPQYNDLYQSLLNQSYSKIVEISSKLFKTQLDEENLKIARNIVAYTPEKFLNQTIDQTIESFKKTFRFLGLSEYQLEVVNQHGFNFRPQASQKKIVMSKYAKLDFFSIDSEVKHELAHIIRYENGIYNQIKPSEDYLPTEEGLATYCQDYAGEDGHVSLFQHAAEYAVTHVALKGSLRKMINYLTSIGFPKDLAWQRAIRHKYGWIDTSQAGDIMKPSMYFHYQQKVKQLSDDEKYRLFVGKIRLDELELYPTYKGIISEDKLKEFYVWGMTL